MQLPSSARTKLSSSFFTELQRAGVGTLVVQRSAWKEADHRRLVALARQFKTRLIEPRLVPRTKLQLSALRQTCRARRLDPRTCAVAPPSPDSARDWLRRSSVDYVVVRVESPSGFLRAKWPSSKRTRLVGIVALGANASIAGWTNAVAAASATTPMLGVAPEAIPSPAFSAYLALLAAAQEGAKRTAGGVPDNGPPTAPGNPTLIANSQSTLTVRWQASTDDVGVTGYEVFLNGVSKGTTADTVITLSGLDCETRFTVGVEAVDASGKHSPRASVDAMTQYGCAGKGGGGGGGGGGPTPPGAPTGVALSSATPTSLSVAWTAPAGAITGYKLFLDTVNVGMSTSTSFTFTGLTCATSYTVGVVAYDSQANSAQTTSTLSTAACPPGSDTTAPTAPGALVVGTTTTTSVSVSWASSTDAVGVTGYGRYRNGTLVSSGTGTTYTFTGLTCGTSYTLGIDAYDAANNRSTRTTTVADTGACADTQAPTTPTGLAQTAVTTTSVSVSWTASGDNVAVTGYGRYQNGTLVSNAVGTTHTFSGLTCGTSYTLAVDAYDAAGNRSGRAQLTATTSACPPGADTQAPTTPTGLAVTTTAQTSLGVAWTASTDNVGVTGYGRYRNGSLLSTAAGTTFSFTGLTCGTTYTLAVDAVDAAGNRSGKAQVSGTTSACSPPADTQAPTTPAGPTVTGQTTNSVSVSWGASSDNVGVTGYGRYQNGSLLSTATGTSFTFSGLSCGTSYTFAVDAVDAAGNRSGKAQTTASTSACAPPSGSANLYLSPAGNDANPCSQAQPCRSFNRAYHAAASGQTVEVAAGSYGGETISGDASKTSSTDVLFRPASGAAVTVTGSLDVQAAHMEFRDMTITEFNFNRQADDVTVRNVVNHGVWMQGPSNISIIGGEISCGACGYHSHIEGGGSDNRPPTNILFDGVNFHDWHSIAGEHVECLQILGGDNVTIRNSTFKDCGTGSGGLGATADLHIAWLGNGPMTKNILIENNFFYASGNPYVIQMDDYANVDLRYNTIAGPIIVWDRSGPGTGIDIVGNILKASTCTAESSGVAINWAYNVIQGGTCSGTDKNAAPGYVDANNNLHLAAGSAAINAGDPGSSPAADIDGQARPMGGRADAGADEAG